jgi:hypothetical protein
MRASRYSPVATGPEVPVADAGFFTDGWGIAEGDVLRIGTGAPVVVMKAD